MDIVCLEPEEAPDPETGKHTNTYLHRPTACLTTRSVVSGPQATMEVAAIRYYTSHLSSLPQARTKQTATPSSDPEEDEDEDEEDEDYREDEEDDESDDSEEEEDKGEEEECGDEEEVTK